MQMYRLSGALLLGALVLSACDSAGPADGPTAATSPVLAAASVSASSATLDGHTDTPVARHIVSAQRLPGDFQATVEALGGTVTFQHPIGLALVDGLSDAAAEQLQAVSGIDAVDADMTFVLDPEATEAPVEATVQSPADAFFYTRGYQWHMDAIGAPVAWAAGRTGSPDVTVAIIDSGLDDQHFDLQGRVDVERSVSLLAPTEFDYVIRDALFPGRPDWLDLNSHGTHVGATVSSNGVVGAGVTDQVKLMAVKVCRYNNSCSGGAILAGVLYAADNGADVANMSLGGSFDRSDIAGAGFAGYIGYLNRVFTYASRQGMITIVSAGNSAFDLDRDGDAYKTYCDTPGTVCVAATGPLSSTDIRVGPFFDVKAPAVYTNYGRTSVDVAAPGGNSGGFVWAACSSTRVNISATGSITPANCTLGKGYITGKSGTSMATPHVSGLAALLVEDFGRSPRRILSHMQRTAEDLGPRGSDSFYGRGYINVPAALGLQADA